MKNLVIAFTLMLSNATFANAYQVPEKLLGYLVTKDGILFQVPSGGCTNRESFRFQTTRTEETDVVQLLMIRVKPDLCFALLPDGVRVEYSYEELGINFGERFTVLNKHAAGLNHKRQN